MKTALALILGLCAAPWVSSAPVSEATSAFHRGLAACDRGDWVEALRCASAAVTAEPGNAWFNYGWASANGLAATKAGLFTRLGYARKSLAGYRRAAELDPTNPVFHVALLRWYAQVPWIAGGNRDEAAKEAAILLRLDPVQARRLCQQLGIR